MEGGATGLICLGMQAAASQRIQPLGRELSDEREWFKCLTGESLAAQRQDRSCQGQDYSAVPRPPTSDSIKYPDFKYDTWQYFISEGKI